MGSPVGLWRSGFALAVCNHEDGKTHHANSSFKWRERVGEGPGPDGARDHRKEDSGCVLSMVVCNCRVGASVKLLSSLSMNDRQSWLRSHPLRKLWNARPPSPLTSLEQPETSCGLPWCKEPARIQRPSKAGRERVSSLSYPQSATAPRLVHAQYLRCGLCCDNGERGVDQRALSTTLGARSLQSIHPSLLELLPCRHFTKCFKPLPELWRPRTWTRRMSPL